MAKQANVLAVSGVTPALKKKLEALAKENLSSVSGEVRRAMIVHLERSAGHLADVPDDKLEAAEAEVLRRVQLAGQDAETLLRGRAHLAAVEVEALIGGEEAIATELERRSEIDANAQPYRQIVDFIETNAPSVPGYAFVVAVAYAAGQAASFDAWKTEYVAKTKR